MIFLYGCLPTSKKNGSVALVAKGRDEAGASAISLNGTDLPSKGIKLVSKRQLGTALQQ